MSGSATGSNGGSSLGKTGMWIAIGACASAATLAVALAYAYYIKEPPPPPSSSNDGKLANNVGHRRSRSSRSQRNSRAAERYQTLEEEDEALGSACSLKALNSNEGVQLGGSHGSTASSPAVIQVRSFGTNLRITMEWRWVRRCRWREWWRWWRWREVVEVEEAVEVEEVVEVEGSGAGDVVEVEVAVEVEEAMGVEDMVEMEGSGGGGGGGGGGGKWWRWRGVVKAEVELAPGVCLDMSTGISLLSSCPETRIEAAWR
eukprot:jgi/Botrbrau1/4497/Bobra.0220s0030.1